MKWSCLLNHSLVVNGKKNTTAIPLLSSQLHDMLHRFNAYRAEMGEIVNVTVNVYKTIKP